MNVVAVIPARGGSKGIKDKNLVDIGGMPLVAHSILHAIEASSIDKVIVSSDSERIIEAALKFGAEVPFRRPADLAEDHVLDLPVFEHAINYLEQEEEYLADFVVHLRPTAPFRKSGWIDEAVQLLMDNPEADSVRSVSEVVQHPYRMFEIDGEGYLDPIMKHEHHQPYLLRRQDLPAIYYYNCVIDISKPATIFGKGSMTGDRILPFILEPDDVIDIDTTRDLAIAREIFF